MMTTPKLASDVEIEETSAEVLVHDVARAKVHVLNASAGRVLRMCDGTRTTEHIAQAMAAEGSDPERVRREVIQVVRKFADLGLVEEPAAS